MKGSSVTPDRHTTYMKQLLTLSSSSKVVSIENMDIKLKQSNHKLLFNIFKPLLFKVIKPVVQKVVEKQIRDNVAKLDAMCYRAKQEADRAAESARRNPDPDNVQNIPTILVSATEPDHEGSAEERGSQRICSRQAIQRGTYSA